jgi:hypothetical protein
MAFSRNNPMEKNAGYPAWYAISFCISLFLPHSSLAKTLTVEGYGINEDAAVRSALQSAVEQGVGLRIASESIVKNYQLISDKILSNTQGYVSSYSVVAKSREFGSIKVKVTADVAMGRLENDLIAQKLLYEIANKPRIMVLLDERANDKDLFERTATHLFEEALIKRGFMVVEPEQFKQNREIEKAKALANPELASLAFREGADLIVRGAVSVAQATPVMIYGTQFYSVPIQINVRIVKADDAQIVASKTKSIRKNSQTEFSAMQFGLEIAGRELAGDLIGSLMEFWRSEAYNENAVQLVITGCPEKELGPLEKQIKGVSFVRGMRLRYLEGTNALYDCDLRGTVQDLREEINKLKNLNLSIVSVTAHRLEAAGDKKEQAVSFENTPPNLDIVSLDLGDIFPCRIRYYETHPLAHVKLKCGPVPIENITLGVIIPDIMDLPAQVKIAGLRADEERQFSVTVLLKGEKVLSTPETRSLYGQVTVSFFENGRTVRRKLTAPVKVFDKNAMDWTEPLSIAGFVTFKDPSVDALAKKAIQSVSDGNSMNKDLLHAMAIFQSLRLLSLKYAKKTAVYSGVKIIDRVQYPSETLKNGSGNCADLSALYCALLEAIGIEPAVISYADHVLVMFNTGIFEKNHFSLTADSLKFIRHKGTLWIPVETTLLVNDFQDVWATAGQEFHQSMNEGRPVSIIDLVEAGKRYPPVNAPAGEMTFDLPGLGQSVNAVKTQMDAQAHNELNTEIARLKALAGQDPEKENRLGILCARKGDLAPARDIFEKLMKRGAGPAVVNNYACALLLSGDEKRSLEYLEKIYESDKTGVAAVNRALCIYVRSQNDGDVDAFVSAMKKALVMAPGNEKLAEYLGMDLTEGPDVRAAGDHEKAEPRKIDRRRLKQLIRDRVLKDTLKKSTGSSLEAGLMPFGGIRGADPDQIEKVAELLYWFEAIQ